MNPFLSLLIQIFQSRRISRTLSIVVIFFYKAFIILYIWIISAETSKTDMITNTIWAQFFPIWYMLVFLNPTSKLSSFKYCHSLLEQPTYHLHDIYRALTVLAEESDYIQAELYRNSNYIHKRNTRVLYYDCTNYYFEIEQETWRCQVR